MTTDKIKQSVSMLEVVERYGYRPNRAGFISCPFHNGDRTPSMKIYKRDYHCHACSANGDIFSFVMGMENCDFKTAYKSLGGTYQQRTSNQHKTYQYHLEKRKQTEKNRIVKLEQRKREIFEEIRVLKLCKLLYPVFSDEWCDAVNRLEYDFYLLEEIDKER